MCILNFKLYITVMSLKDILSVFDSLLSGALKAGLFDKHEVVKAVIAHRDALAEKAAAETPVIKID